LLPAGAAGDLAPHLSGSRRSSLASRCGLSRRCSWSRDAAAGRRRAGVVFSVRLLGLVRRWGVAVMNDTSAPTRDRIIHCRVLRNHFRRLTPFPGPFPFSRRRVGHFSGRQFEHK
jgi:hypothetical protein